MTRLLFRRAVALFSLSAIACDGDVNLGGEKGGCGSEDAASLSVIPPPQDAVKHEVVARLDCDSYVSGLAVVGEELYLSGYGRSQPILKRCNKDVCSKTLDYISQEGGALGWIQGYDGRLAGSEHGENLERIVTYAVPGLTDEQLVIGDLVGVGDPLFHEGFVYWPLSADAGIYRCALPDCPTGPERLGSGQSRVAIAGSFAFWTSSTDSYLRRARLDAVESSQALLADEVLSEAPEKEESSQDVYDGWVLAGSERYLYAAWSGEGAAPDQAPLGVVRWPAEGGARAVVIEEGQPIRALFLFERELAYIVLESRLDNVGTLVSCLVDDCSATRRILDRVRLTSSSVTADEASLYYLGIERDRDPYSGSIEYTLDREIRRVPLLPDR